MLRPIERATRVRQVVDCLAHHEVASDIFREYLDHVTDLLAKRETHLAALSGPDGYMGLGLDYVQFTLVQKLRDACPANLGGLKINRDRSIGGAPWTHLRFADVPAAYAETIGEVLYHRVDIRHDGPDRRYYLSTRQYARVKADPDARMLKRHRLAVYRRLFAQAIASAPMLTFATPTTDNAGANESEIGILFFDAGSNSTANVLEHFAKVHEAFVNLVKVERFRSRFVGQDGDLEVAQGPSEDARERAMV